MHCVRWFAGRQETLCGLAVRQPWVHTHPSLLSQKPTTVDYMRRTYNTLVQFSRSSSGKFPPQYKSSASFDMKPAWIWSPNTRHKDSSRAVSEPGIPIAHLVYTRSMPLQGVMVPQYFMDREIWENALVKSVAFKNIHWPIVRRIESMVGLGHIFSAYRHLLRGSMATIPLRRKVS